MKPEMVLVPKVNKFELEKLENLRQLCKYLINTYIFKAFKELLVKTSNQTSTKQVLFSASKVRNIRNALRNIKGKKLRSLSNDSRLTVRIMDTTKSDDLKSKSRKKKIDFSISD